MRQWLDKISTYFLRFVPFILVFFIPLFFLPFTADFFTFNKFYLTTAVASLSLLAWCVRSLIRGKLAITTSPSLTPLFILALAHIISSLWLSPTKHNSLFGQSAFIISLLIIFFTTTSSQKNKTLINSVIFGLIASVTLLSLTTLLHYFGLLSKIFPNDLIANKFFNPSGGVPIALTLTLPILVAAVSYLIIAKDWLIKSLLFAASIIMIVAALINLTLIFPQGGQQTVFLLPQIAGWSIAVDVFKNWQTALLGTGPDTYLTTFTRLRPGFLNLNNALWALRFPESGSFLLTLMTTTGVIGLLAFIFTFVKPLIISLKHRAAHTDDPAFVFLTTALTGFIITYLLTPASVATLVSGLTILIAITVEYKLIGLKNAKDVSLSLSAKQEPESLYQNLSEDASLHPYQLVLPWIVTLLSAVLLILYWLYAIPAYSASMQIKQASDLINTNPVGAYMKELNAAKLDPYNSNYPMALSQFFKSASLNLLTKKDITDEDKKNASEYMQRAIDYGKRAAQLNPFNVIVWENLAGIYESFIGAADGASNFAVSHFVQAITLDPTNPELRLKLGVLFFNLGDEEQAIKLIGQAIELKKNWEVPYYNLGLIYKSKKDPVRAKIYFQAGIQYANQNSDAYSKFQKEITDLQASDTSQEATPSGTPR